MISIIVCGFIMLGLLTVDLVTKAWAYAAKIETPYFLGIIRLKYLPGGNTGMAFGMFSNTPTAMAIITAITVRKRYPYASAAVICPLSSQVSLPFCAAGVRMTSTLCRLQTPPTDSAR